MTKQEIEQAASNADCRYNEPLAFEAGFIAGAEFVLKRAEKLVDALSSIVETYHFDKNDLGIGACGECDHGWAGEQVDEYKHDLNCPFSILSRSLKEWRGE